MNRQISIPAALGFFITSALTGSAVAQTTPEHSDSVPLYRVTVVQRTIDAINYQYRSGPTAIDFKGTVLLPNAKGNATIESKAGRVEVDAHFEKLPAPTRFGREYLTYVLWAISPEGHAKNLGEALAGSSDKAKLHVTTDLQAFGLVVTAEPYAAVRQPSDVIVLENQIRPETIGSAVPIHARYELLPRGQYTYNIPADMKAAEGNGPMVSMDEYETTLEIYQGQNAVQIAQANGATQYAPEVMSKASAQLEEAKRLQAQKADKSLVIRAARNAAQTAEDARAISEKRKQQADLDAAQAKASDASQRAEQEQQRRLQAEAAADSARAQASADRMQLDRERDARKAAENAVAAPPPVTIVPGIPVAQAPETLPAPPPPLTSAAISPATIPPPPGPPLPPDRDKRQLRSTLQAQLNLVLSTRDTPRGLVVTIPDAPPATALARIAALVAVQPGLVVEVDGNTDGAGPDADRIATERAMAVRAALIRDGLPADIVNARNLGAANPLGTNKTAQGRAQNRRVEIVISGDPIGNIASWDKTYSIRQ